MTEKVRVRGRPATGGLAGVLLADHTMDGLATLVIDVALASVQGIDDVSVTARRGPGDFATAHASSQRIVAIDQVQYDAGAGPCVHATVSGAEISSPLPDARWPDFSEAVISAGVHSVRSLPLRVRDEPIGALNLYSSSTGEVADETLDGARALATQAAVLFANAAALALAEQRNAQLREALESRTVIGQAQGILMSRQSINPDEAFDILRRASQRTNRKLRDVAADIVANLPRRGQQ